MEHGVALFVQWLFRRGCRDWTVAGRYFSLHSFTRWCRSLSGSAQLQTPDTDMLRGYFAHLKERGLSGYAVRNHKASPDLFFGFLSGVGYRPDNPMERVRVQPRIEPQPVTILQPEELHAMLRAAKDRYQQTPRHRHALRVRALRAQILLETLLATGLRACELAELNVDDVDLEQGRLQVRGKGGGLYVKRNRTAFIDHPVLLAHLAHYLALRVATPESPLFPSLYGRHFRPDQGWLDALA